MFDFDWGQRIYDILKNLLKGQREIMTALSDLQAAVAAEETEEAAVLTYLKGIPALITEAVAAAQGNLTAQNAALEALASQITTDTASLTSGVAAAPVEPSTALTLSVTTVSAVDGVASSVPLTVTGGTPPYIASNLPADVSYTAGNVTFGNTTIAGNTTVTISDSTSPTPLTTTFTIVIS